MKAVVEISEDEILEAAKRIVSAEVAKGILGEYRNGCYRKVIKECVREAIKKDIDNLSNRAVEAASKSIENRAVKKMMQKMIEEA